MEEVATILGEVFMSPDQYRGDRESPCLSDLVRFIVKYDKS